MSAKKPKAVVSWSSGKDSAYAYHVANLSGEYAIVGIITTITENFKRVSMHGVREELLDEQIKRINLPCTKIIIPSPCTNEIYEEKMGKAIKELKAAGVTHVIFGDLYLEDIRAYRQRQMKKAGMICVFPLWLKNTRELADEMTESGLRSIITCVDPKQLDKSFAGRIFGMELHKDLPMGVDLCGENGEFHTFVTHGPMFSSLIDVKLGEIVERDGFIFADVIPNLKEQSDTEKKDNVEHHH